MAAYYNEIDPYVSDWLRRLIAAGLIAPGEVDTRSIEDVHPDDLKRFTQCHFFAGIGGWSLALRLAGWPDDRAIWTGSCPCQPFSAAGKGLGVADERHLWPHFHHLIWQCRPAVVAGEQVASAAGRDWLATVRADLEALGYAVGAADLCSASVGAPHIRQRLYWVADSHVGSEGVVRGRDYRVGERRSGVSRGGPGGCGTDVRPGSAPGPADSFWADADWIFCRDGHWRPVEPGSFPLAHGVPGHVELQRAYGNAITPQAAAEFIKAALL